MEKLSPRDNRGDKIIPPPADADPQELMDAIVVPSARLRNAYLVHRYGKSVLRSMHAIERDSLYRAAVSGAITPDELNNYPPIEDEFDEDYTPDLFYTEVTSNIETVDLPPFDGDNSEAA